MTKTKNMKLNPISYKNLIEEDKGWLIKNAPESLERAHILAVLDDSVKHYSIKINQIREESQAVSKETISDSGFYSSDNIDETLFGIDIFVSGQRIPELERRIIKYHLDKIDKCFFSITLGFWQRCDDSTKEDELCSKLIKTNFINRIEKEQVMFIVSKFNRYGHIVAQSAFVADSIDCYKESETLRKDGWYIYESSITFSVKK